MSGSVDYTQLFSSPYSTAADGLLNVMYGGAPGSALGAANPLLALRTAQAARARLEERFSWAHVARQFEAICQAALEGRKA